MNLLWIAGMCIGIALLATTMSPVEAKSQSEWDWKVATPESQGMNSARLDALWDSLRQRHTDALLVIRNDAVVFERYAPGYSRSTPHYTASLAKALVGGVSLMVAMNDKRIKPDDPAWKYVPQWTNDPRKKRITIRHLATHTSGIEDAEADELPHEQLTGWKGDFWKQLQPPHDPFTLSRDSAPVMENVGTEARYSNPGMAMLAYCVTAGLRGAREADLRSLLKKRIMEPLGVSEKEWVCGYGKTYVVDGLNLVANWGGGSYSSNAAARIGRLMLRRGDWNAQSLIASSVVKTATTYAGTANYSGLGWWVNGQPGGAKKWDTAPDDAFWGAGAGHQFLLVIPSQNLIVVRYGERMDNNLNFDAGLETHLVNPLMQTFDAASAAPYPPSPVIKSVAWAPKETIRRLAFDNDCWPLTWADDDNLYTAYGDGYGFDPTVPEKLSLGFAKIVGGPTDFTGVNISSNGEQKGDGPQGKKASGMLMVDGILYMWVRNAGNSQLASSRDHGKTWTWSDWKFTESFGCPAFLNFGKNYAGARDRYVYLCSPDSESAYLPADGMVLARVPGDKIVIRNAYEFFQRLDAKGRPIWTKEIAQRGPVFSYPGRCLRSQMTYNPALKRYLWWQQIPNVGKDRADSRFRGGFGVYDAPEPWGPWTTVYFTTDWDVGPGETGSFPTKWMSVDGRTLHLVFSGDDFFSIRAVTLTLARDQAVGAP